MVQLSHPSQGFPVGQMVKNLLQCSRPGFHTWVGKIPWRGKELSIPVFLPGKSHGQRNLAGYRLRGHRESDKTEQLTHSYPYMTTGKTIALTLGTFVGKMISLLFFFFLCFSFFLSKFICFNQRLITLQYCIGFAIHQHESAMGVQVCYCFPSKEQASFNFMAAVTDNSDFGAPENKTVTASTFFFFHFFSYLS